MQLIEVTTYEGNVIKTTRFQLLQWKHALRLEAKGLTMSRGKKVSTHLRKLLDTPARLPIERLSEFVEGTLDDVNEQMTGD